MSDHESSIDDNALPDFIEPFNARAEPSVAEQAEASAQLWKIAEVLMDKRFREFVEAHRLPNREEALSLTLYKPGNLDRWKISLVKPLGKHSGRSPDLDVSLVRYDGDGYYAPGKEREGFNYEVRANRPIRNDLGDFSLQDYFEPDIDYVNNVANEDFEEKMGYNRQPITLHEALGLYEFMTAFDVTPQRPLRAD